MQTACGTRLAGRQTVLSQETVFLFTDAQKGLWRERGSSSEVGSNPAPSLPMPLTSIVHP